MRLHPILSIDVLLNYLHSTQRIPDEDFRRAMRYLMQEGEARSEFD